MTDRPRLGVVMDPIGAIKVAKDSTLAMLLAAQARGLRPIGAIMLVGARICPTAAPPGRFTCPTFEKRDARCIAGGLPIC